MIQSYFTLLLLCLGVSLRNKSSRQGFLWIYFLMVSIFELGRFYGLLTPAVYNSSPLFYIAFFCFYYSNEPHSYRKIVYALGTIAIAYCLSVFYHHGFTNYSIKAGVAVSIAYIVFTLLWFLSQLSHVNDISLPKKQAFWVSTALLIWAVFFLFRLIPMYWLNSNDILFLTQINIAYQVLTIVSYGIFLRALFCKY